MIPADAPPPVHPPLGNVAAAVRGDGGAVGPELQAVRLDRPCDGGAAAVRGGHWLRGLYPPARPPPGRGLGVGAHLLLAKQRVHPVGAHQEEWPRGSGWSYITGRNDPDLIVPPGPDVTVGAEWDVLGFGRRQYTWTSEFVGPRNRAGFPYTIDETSVPHGLLCLITATLPAIACARLARGKRRRRRSRRGLCPSCGYDLRATPGRCPECGTPAAASVNPAG